MGSTSWGARAVLHVAQRLPVVEPEDGTLSALEVYYQYIVFLRFSLNFFFEDLLTPGQLFDRQGLFALSKGIRTMSRQANPGSGEPSVGGIGGTLRVRAASLRRQSYGVRGRRLARMAVPFLRALDWPKWMERSCPGVSTFR